MISFINRLLGRGLEKIVLGAGAMAAFFAILWRAFSKGEQRERERQEAKRAVEESAVYQKYLEDRKRTRERQDEIDRLTDAAVAERLRDKWTRHSDD